MHNIVETLGAVKKIIQEPHDTEDTKGKYPNTDDGNDMGFAVLKPSEEAKECG